MSMSVGEEDEVGMYKLRCTLLGHSMDVRGVATGRTESGKEFVVSGSRDRSSKVWMPSDTDNGFAQFQSCEGHTNFVSCVHTIPPNQNHPTGLILSGGNDHTILAFELGKHQPVFRLVGHKGTVCSLDGTTDSLIISGSWDLSAKVWEEQNCVATLEGHTAAVWAVATIPGTVGEHRILTGSADKEIRLWINYNASKVYAGHTDCVRTLAVVDSEKFLSGSNDATIRLWSVMGGETLQTFYGHTNFIYSIAIMPSGAGFVSVGEDRTLRIWRNGLTAQVLFHPATSVWTVSCLDNGDIATGSSDGTLRIFSNDPSRFGSHDLLSAFEEEVSKSVVAAQQDLGGMKISELPGRETLLVPGKSDGETKMVREGDKVGCFSWSSGEKKWSKVGDVVGASGATQGTSGKVLHEGKEYDYVFSVDLEDQKSLKLPYNVTEDPWWAAQKFIHKNELSQLFLDQVANFIITNTKGVQLGTVAENNDFADPFTGGNRYVPGSGGGASQYSSGGGGAALDPFTGSGAYTTSTSSQEAAKSSGSATELNNSNSGPCFPIEEFIQFTTPPNYTALEKKLVEFVTSFGEDASGPVWKEKIEALLNIGRKAEWNERVEEVVKDCLLRWPADKIFPILDLLRLGVATPSFVIGLNTTINVVTEFCGKFMCKGTATNQMLSLRLLCNAFGPLTPNLASDRAVVVSQMLNSLSKVKTNEIAAATLILNYSIVAAGLNKHADVKYATGESQTEILMTAVQMLDQIDDPEALFRLLVTIGNVIHGNGAMTNLFLNLGGPSLLKNFKDVTSSVLPKIKNCCEQIESAIRAAAAADSGPGSSSRMN